MDIEPTSPGGAPDSSRLRIPSGGVLAGLVCGLLGGAVLGAIYAHIGAWIPVFCLPVPVFLGWGIGAACGLGSRLGGRLGPWTGRALGTVSGLAAMYAAWVFWILALSRYGVLVVSPAALHRTIGHLAENGVWTVRGHTPKDGELLLVWIVELAVVVLVSAGAAGMYCEEREHERRTDDSRVF